MIYFDAAAAAPPDPAVLDFQRETALRCYANQEASHAFARSLRRKMEEAAQKLALLLADESYHVGELIARAVFHKDEPAVLAQIADDVKGMLAAHPLYPEI